MGGQQRLVDGAGLVPVHDGEAGPHLAEPVALDARIVGVEAAGGEDMGTALHGVAQRDGQLLLDSRPRAPPHQGPLELLGVHPALPGDGEDLVAHRDRAALPEQRHPQRPVERLARREPLLLGRLDGLHRQQGAHRVGVVGALPQLPAGLRLQRADDRGLRLQDQLGRGHLVDQFQRERPDVEAHPLPEPERRPDGVQPVHGEVGPGASDVGEDDQGAGGHVEAHRAASAAPGAGRALIRSARERAKSPNGRGGRPVSSRRAPVTVSASPAA